MNLGKKKALYVIVLFGLISLFGDIIYEGARSVNGPYLKILGANAVLVGLIAGLGEFLGYGIRIVSGYFSDKTKAYWVFTIIGYGMLITVPLLSLTGIWQIAAFFMVAERIGKAIRSPSRDTIMSSATKKIGTGFGFGIAEFLDQIGAVTGPLIFTALFFLIKAKEKTISHYQLGYSLFWIPFVILMAILFIAFFMMRHPEKQEKKTGETKLSKTFWMYTLFSFITTIGFVNFALIGFHLKTQNILTDTQIPFFYAIAMGIDAVAALAIGKIYDNLKTKHANEHAGLYALIIIPLLTAVIPFFTFSFSVLFVVIGMVLWGIVMGAHETIMKAAIADITSITKRGTGYGIFNASYGFAMFLGSTLVGFLYGVSIPAIIIVTIVLQVITLFVFFKMKREAQKTVL
jgi:MFS family permease